MAVVPVLQFRLLMGLDTLSLEPNRSFQMDFSSTSDDAGAVKGAFSLIELLVVMGIIALLAGMVVPAITVLREKGKETACGNNMRQWGQALGLYLDEKRGIFPSDGTDGSDGAPDINKADAWYNVLPGYLQGVSLSALAAQGKAPCGGVGKSLFVCPNTPIDNDMKQAYAAGTQSKFFVSYAFNYWINMSKTDPAYTTRMRLSQISNPANFVVFSESPDGKAAKVHPATMFDPSTGATAFRHRDCANAVFADGHVEPLRRKAVWRTGVTVNDNFGNIQWNPAAAMTK